MTFHPFLNSSFVSEYPTVVFIKSVALHSVERRRGRRLVMYCDSMYLFVWHLYVLLSFGTNLYASGCRVIIPFTRLSKFIGSAAVASCATFLLPHNKPSYAFSSSGEIIYRDEGDGEETQQQSLKEQLKVVQALQLQEQLRVVKQAKRGKEIETLDFNDVNTIVKGVVSIRADGASIADFPLGYPDATSLNEAFGDKRAYLYITAVGKNGPPFAAKRYRLNSIRFPFEFTVSIDDLLFPYNRDTWLKSPLSKGPVVVTGVIDQDGVLATSSDIDRFGFAISDPENKDDTFSRTPANVEINLKSDGKMYSKNDLEILTRVDSEIERLEKIGMYLVTHLSTFFSCMANEIMLTWRVHEQ